MMNGHESHLVRMMIKVIIMVTMMVKIDDEFRNPGVYIRRKDSLMSSIRIITVVHYSLTLKASPHTDLESIV